MILRHTNEVGPRQPRKTFGYQKVGQEVVATTNDAKSYNLIQNCLTIIDVEQLSSSMSNVCFCLPVDEETVKLVDYISRDFIIKHSSSVDYYQEIEQYLAQTRSLYGKKQRRLGGSIDNWVMSELYNEHTPPQQQRETVFLRKPWAHSLSLSDGFSPVSFKRKE